MNKRILFPIYMANLLQPAYYQYKFYLKVIQSGNAVRLFTDNTFLGTVLQLPELKADYAATLYHARANLIYNHRYCESDQSVYNW